MGDSDDSVGDGEEKGVLAECTRYRERRDQHCGHRAEEGKPHEPLLRIDRIRQPGVGGPGPPENP